jgi:hypothetical protein
MKLEIQMTGYDAAGVARVSEAVLPLVESVAGESGITDRHLDRLIIADEAHYGLAIELLVAGEKHTNANGLLGVAKTLTFIGEQGAVRNHIVILAELINALLEGQASGVPAKQWKPELQLAAYVLPHDFGHCFDNIERSSAVNGEQGLGKSFKLARFANYYGNIATGEYAASFFSARSGDWATSLSEK